MVLNLLTTDWISNQDSKAIKWNHMLGIEWNIGFGLYSISETKPKTIHARTFMSHRKITTAQDKQINRLAEWHACTPLILFGYACMQMKSVLGNMVIVFELLLEFEITYCFHLNKGHSNIELYLNTHVGMPHHLICTLRNNKTTFFILLFSNPTCVQKC